MDITAVRALYDRRLRREAAPDRPDGLVERTESLVTQVGPDRNAWNGVVWSALDETTADAAIADRIARFAALGREFEWKLHDHDLPADLGDRLRAAGLVPEEPETLFVADVRDLDLDPPPPDGIRLVAVDGPDGVELAARAQAQAFGRSADAVRRRLLPLLDDPRGVHRITVALAGDIPVAAARAELFPGTGFTGLWGGGTIPEWRGRGVYRALVAHRARAAVAEDCRYLQVDASAASAPILRRLGFVALGTTTPYVRPCG